MEINRILGSFRENNDHLAELTINNNSICLKLGEYIIISKLIEGNYPNFNKVIPESTQSKISIDRFTFKNSLNIISKVVNQQYKGVKLTPSSNSLHLISSNTESEVGEDQIDAQYDGDELSIGFNISYIQDVIDVLDSENIHICINDQNSGCILTGESDTNSVYVIMPMRV
jgi:DNA polymerase-3 subunit beta